MLPKHASSERILFSAAIAMALSAGACQRTTAPNTDRPAPIGTSKEPLPITANETQVPSSSRAQFFAPAGVVAIGDQVHRGNEFFSVHFLVVGDALNNTIRRVEAETGFTTTIAGTAGVEGSSGSLFRKAAAVALEKTEARILLVADTGNHVIRKIWDSLNDETQQIATVAGVAGQRGYQNGSTALFDGPQGIAIESVTPPANGHDVQVTSILVVDTGNSVVRRVNVSTGQVTLVAGTPAVHGFIDASSGAQAKFNRPTGIALYGTTAYVADTGNHVIRSIDLTSGGTNPVSTFAGMPGVYGHRDGAATQALFSQPLGLGLAVEQGAVGLIVADRASHTIRKIAVPQPGATPVVTTLAGIPWSQGSLDGNASIARFRAPSGVSFANGTYYVADTGNNLIRAIKPAEAGVSVSTIVGQRAAGGSDGWPQDFTLGQPKTITCDGNRLIVDGAGVRIIDLDPGMNSGAARTVTSSPNWNGSSYASGALYRKLSYGCERLDLVTGEVTPFVDAGMDGSVDNLLATPYGIFVMVNGSLERYLLLPNGALSGASQNVNYVTLGQAPVWTDDHLYSWNDPNTPTTQLLRSDPTVDPIPTADIPVAVGAAIRGLAVKDGVAYFTIEGESAVPYRHAVRKINLTTGAISAFLGSASGVGDPFESPNGLCITGNNLFVADTGHGAIRRVDLSTGQSVALDVRRAE